MSTASVQDHEGYRTGINAFCVDGMLGGLAKWLRILGFDTSYPCMTPGKDRIFLTTKKSSMVTCGMRVTEPRALGQLKEVLDETGVKPDPALFLSRCLVCNVPVARVALDEVCCIVPLRVQEMTNEFTRCPTCGRVYWEGTHPQRMKRRMIAEGIL